MSLPHDGWWSSAAPVACLLLKPWRHVQDSVLTDGKGGSFYACVDNVADITPEVNLSLWSWLGSCKSLLDTVCFSSSVAAGSPWAGGCLITLSAALQQGHLNVTDTCRSWEKQTLCCLGPTANCRIKPEQTRIDLMFCPWARQRCTCSALVSSRAIQSVLCMLIQLLLKAQFSSSALLMHSVSLRGNEDSSETFQIFNYAFEGLMLLRPMWISFSLHSFNKLKSMMSLLFSRASSVEETSGRLNTRNNWPSTACGAVGCSVISCMQKSSLCCNDVYVTLPSIEPKQDFSHVCEQILCICVQFIYNIYTRIYSFLSPQCFEIFLLFQKAATWRPLG